MIKFNDAGSVIHKKISRNKEILSIYSLWQNLLNKEIEIKKKYIENCDMKKKYITEINELELLQTTEYDIQRQTKIREMMRILFPNSVVSINELSLDDDNTNMIKYDINSIKDDINYRADSIRYIQSLIPKCGYVNNYQFKL